MITILYLPIYFIIMTEKIQSKHLEKHQTKNIDDQSINGSLTVIWRDWDSKFPIDPKMIYTTSVFSGERKGPHLHKKRDSFFVCIRGKVAFVIQDNSGSYQEIISSENDPVMIHVPKNFASGHVNLSNDTSIILTIANLAWRPNDEEMVNVVFDDYDWEKWKKNVNKI